MSTQIECVPPHHSFDLQKSAPWVSDKLMVRLLQHSAPLRLQCATCELRVPSVVSRSSSLPVLLGAAFKGDRLAKSRRVLLHISASAAALLVEVHVAEDAAHIAKVFLQRIFRDFGSIVDEVTDGADDIGIAFIVR